MRINRVIAAITVVCLSVAAFAALTLHSFSATTSNDSLTVNFSVSGLGNVKTANFTVQAQQVIVVKCINKAGKEPPGQIKTVSDVSASGSFAAVNGRTTGSLTLPAPDPSPYQHLCPPGFRAVSVDVTAYTNIKLIAPDGSVLKTVATVSS